MRREGMFGLCVRGRDRQTDRQGASVAESSSEIQARCSHRNTLCSGNNGSQQHSPFLQPVGTTIFWGYFRSVLACICPGRAQAQLTRACAKYTSGHKHRNPCLLPWCCLKEGWSGALIFLRGSRARDVQVEQVERGGHISP